jgi:hypothetical protein
MSKIIGNGRGGTPYTDGNARERSFAENAVYNAVTE